MAGLRFRLDLFIPEDPNGTLVAGVKIPTVLTSQVPTIRQGIRFLKGYARKINVGAANEEMTVRAVFHTCRHDTGGKCEAENDI